MNFFLFLWNRSLILLLSCRDFTYECAYSLIKIAMCYSWCILIYAHVKHTPPHLNKLFDEAFARCFSIPLTCVWSLFYFFQASLNVNDMCATVFLPLGQLAKWRLESLIQCFCSVWIFTTVTITEPISKRPAWTAPPYKNAGFSQHCLGYS